MNIRKLRNKLGAILCSAMMVGGLGISNHVAMAAVIELPGEVKWSEVRSYEKNIVIKKHYLKNWREKFKSNAVCRDNVKIDNVNCKCWVYGISGTSNTYGEYKIDLCLLEDDRFAVIVSNKGLSFECGFLPFSYFVHVLQENGLYDNIDFNYYESLDVDSRYKFLKALNKTFFRMSRRFGCKGWNNGALLDSILEDVNGDTDMILFKCKEKFLCSIPAYEGEEPLFPLKPRTQQIEKEDIKVEEHEVNPLLEGKLATNPNSQIDAINEQKTFAKKELKDNFSLSESGIKKLVEKEKHKPVKKGGKTVYIVVGTVGGGSLLGSGTFALTKFLGKKRGRDLTNTKNMNSSKMNVIMNRKNGLQLNGMTRKIRGVKTSSGRNGNSIKSNRKNRFGQLGNSKS